MKLSEQLWRSLKRMMRAVELQSHRMEQQLGITGPQLMLLKELLEQSGMPVSVLAKKLELSHATVTVMLDRLEKKQYVQRVKDTEDKRKIRVYVTEQVHTLFQHNPSIFSHIFQTEFERLTLPDQEQMVHSFERIAAMMLERAPDLGDVLIADLDQKDISE